MPHSLSLNGTGLMEVKLTEFVSEKGKEQPSCDVILCRTALVSLLFWSYCIYRRGYFCYDGFVVLYHFKVEEDFNVVHFIATNALKLVSFFFSSLSVCLTCTDQL